MSDSSTILFSEFLGDSIQSDDRPLPEDIRVGGYILQRGRFSHVNEMTCRILEMETPDQLIGQSLWQWVYPDDYRRVRIGQGRMGPSGVADIAFRMVTAAGVPVWVAMQGTNTTYRGAPANIGYLVDMASIRYLKTALKKYRARITHVEEAIFETDLKGNIVDCTQRARDMWLISGDEIIGKNYRDLLAPHWADKVLRSYRQVYASGKPASDISYEVALKDGRRLVVEDSVALIRGREGQATGFRSVSRDITRQKEAERRSEEHSTRLLAIFRSVKDAIITVDPEFKVVEANDAVQTICGVDPDVVVGRFFPRQFRHCSGACRTLLRRTLEARETIKDFLIECRHERNRRQIVNVSSSALLDRERDFSGAVLVLRDVSRLQDLERELHPLEQFHGIIGKSKRMQVIYQLLEDMAELETTVLVTGESGTGKEMVARALHISGTRAKRPFLAVNCSALTENLLESELFGHVKGSFTGAVADRQGRFAAAHGGTLLLDEIGDIPLRIQLKLLRVLQEKEIERVGESITRKVDVRIIACTNKDLRREIDAGRFRGDLYYRLKVVEVTMPPLRERAEDVPLLVEHFRKKFNDQFDKRIDHISSEAMACFMDYDWPGNVRELEHAMERAFILSSGTSIGPGDLPPEISQGRPQPAHPSPGGPAVEDVDRGELFEALRRSFWNKAKAARLLGISRPTLYKRIKAYAVLDDPQQQ